MQRSLKQIPYVDCAGIWYPNAGAERAIFADWCDGKKSMTSSSAPVACVFSEDGENRITIAASETKEVIEHRIVTLSEGMQECIVLNGTKGTNIVLESRPLIASIVVKDCCGNIISEETKKVEEDVWKIAVPVGGQVYITSVHKS